METKRRALGRGLESLLPARTGQAAQAGEDEQATGRPRDIPVDLIDRNPYQTRSGFDPEKLEELALSITANGVVQPVVVKAGEDGRYTLIAGERRLLASRQAGKATVPAIVREVSDRQTMEMTIVENLQRADLNPIEQARAYERLSREFHLTQEQMAEQTGKDRASVANFLRLLRLPEDVQMFVAAGTLTFGHARALLPLRTPDDMSRVARKVVELGLNVRATEALVQAFLAPESAPKAPQAKAIDPNVRQAQEHLQSRLGLRVTIHDKKGKGKVVIEYGDVDDFDSILRALGEEE